MIIPLVLYGYQALSSPMFYLSEYLESKREAYYDRLFRITAAGDWNGWVEFFLTAILEQAKQNSQKARSILALYDRMKAQLPEIVATQFSVQTIDALFDRPIFKSSDFVTRSKIPKATAMRILRALQEKGVLKVIRAGGGRRPAILMFRELIGITEGRIT